LEDNEIDKWDGYWTLDGQVPKITPSDDEEDDDEKWDKYWKLESAGTEVFSGCEKEIYSEEDKKVWQLFNRTIEKELMGMTSVFPGKMLTSRCQKDQDLLTKYNEIFEEQLNFNILEEVPEEVEISDNCIHYILHQVVITPQETFA
uniref:Nucleosome assembly protein 1-like 1 n=1 Tax=Heligmosomoides polygyrus TaxID=6339 RepID=A0A183GDB1_HELPZ